MSETDLQTVGYQALVDELARRCASDPLLSRGMVRFGLQQASLTEIWKEVCDRSRDAVLIAVQNGEQEARIWHTAAYAAMGLISAAGNYLDAQLGNAPATCEDDEATS